MRKSVPRLGFVILLSLCVFGINGFSQARQQQRSFSSGEPMDRPVHVPSSFIRLMSREDRRKLNKCQRQSEYPTLRKKNIYDHFLGSMLDVRNSKGGLDLMVVQADSGCFYGAHNTMFWILSKKKGSSSKNYKKIFEGQMDGLDVAKRTSGIYPNLEIINHTAIEAFSTTYRYLRGRYRAGECWAYNMGDPNSNQSRIRCEKYNWEFRK